MRTLQDAALHYADLGYPVFPCTWGYDPAPLTEHGFHDASKDFDQIQKWWNFTPVACIAVSASGLLIVDIDGKDNPWLADHAERARSLLAAPTSVSPGGGRHHYFRRPPGKKWRCSASELAKRVDIRTDGGYAILPPSVRADGAYRWVEGCELEVSPDKLTEPPKWLCDLLDAHAEKPERTKGPIENEIPEGQRNDALTRLAGAMRRVGMSQPEILVALEQVNTDRCQPALHRDEVKRIADSIASYPPDQIATAIAENHFAQLGIGKRTELPALSLNELIARHKELRKPVIHGLLRQGETMNIISAPKIGKSWLVTDLALAVTTGRTWLDLFPTEKGDVLIVDNELHGETSAHRIPKVAAARQIPMEQIGDRVFVKNMRGQLQDIYLLGDYFQSLEPGRYKVIILDAFYRFMPAQTDENDNGAMAHVYNHLDRYADRLGCCFVLIHHTSKGNQAGKNITDVGAGAGSQSRATDTHLILRQHEEDDVVVLEGAVRSWAPIQARCLRWGFPVFTPADDLDPRLLRSERPKRPKKQDADDTDGEEEPTWDAEHFAMAFVTETPQTRNAILFAANEAGLSDYKGERLLRKAEGSGLVHRWSQGRNRPSLYANIPQPTEPEGSK